MEAVALEAAFGLEAAAVLLVLFLLSSAYTLLLHFLLGACRVERRLLITMAAVDIVAIDYTVVQFDGRIPII